MNFLPSPEILATFTLASFVLIFTPGPDMTLFIGKTLTGGRTRGFAAMLGVATGLLIHTMLAVVGLSALLAASATAFTIIKIAGVAYLLWLAFHALRRGSTLTLQQANGKQGIGRVYLMGLAVNLLNPKIVIFFLTFLPQFVSAADPQAGTKLLFLGLYFTALGVPTCAALILAAERVIAAIRRRPRAMRLVDWLFAGLMAGFAVRLLFSRSE